MGTLTDITSKASNKNIRDLNSPMGTSKNAPSQSHGNTKSNFMSPTMASTKKATNASPAPKDDTRNSTPTSIRLEKASTAKWMTSAAKRVGLRRVAGDGTPRSKKEGLKLSSNTVTFPDKLSGFSYSKMPESPQPKPPSMSILSDKPLPSPPVAQVMTGSYGVPRSLIDASEQPLRRTSPKSPLKQEDWPVLFPEKPTSPDIIRQTLHQTTPEPVRLISNGQERYPRLSGSHSANTNPPQESMIRLPSSVQIQRKQVPANSFRDNSAATSAPNGLDDDAHKVTSKYSDSLPSETKNAHRLSAGAAAVEKSTAEAKSIKEPRQTRTSSLRARISAGQVIKDSPNKVLGFTDFTAEKAPLTKTGKEALGSVAASQVRPSTSFGKVFTKKPSKEFLAGTRAPAQFVAGSRRPAARRPSSRNSLRSESRASSPNFLEPSRPAPAVPTARTEASSRKSSIPILRNNVPTATDETSPKHLPIAQSMSRQFSETGVTLNDDFKIFVERSNASTEYAGNGIVATAGNADHKGILESIAESPKSTFRSKRLSSHSPTFGPMLKISSSADRLIMGMEDVNKENRSLAKKRSKDLFRAAVTNEHRNSIKSKTLDHEATKSTGRSSSSQGVPESLQDDNSVAHKEADSTMDFEEKTSRDNGSSENEDTLVIATEQRESPPNGTGKENQEAVRESSYSANPEPFIWPVEIGATPMSDAMPVVPAFLPEALQQHVHKSDSISQITGTDGVKERNDGSGTVPRKNNLVENREQSAPSTPKQTSKSDTETPASSFPPRSSSRMQQPDYTVDGSAKGSPTSSSDQASMRLQNKISVQDFAKPNISDADSFSRLNDVGPKTAHREMSSRTIHTDVASKRDSSTHISQRSQSSVSKGLMSNFRGLFHKRTSDASETPNLRSNKKGCKRPTVNSHGSPTPSMSNIHPLHRPTQASINRSNATIQRSSGNSLVTGAPGTPAVISPLPNEISTTTSLAMQILESARKENSSPKKERLLSLGKIMVDSITQARDAEKAMEEAKQAARKAEVSYVLCKKSIADIANMVQEWKDNSERF
ncbi:MAG: hypothetical protein Q9223_005834 [Gallowayella weberi]